MSSSSSSSSPSPIMILHHLLFLAFALAAAGAAAAGMTHLSLYIHEVFTGANATTVSFASSPTKNSSFGSIGAFDDVLREGSDSGSQLLGRVEGFLVQADQQNAASATVLNFVFTDGDYKGSTLSVVGRAEFGATIERSIVGGTGKFRRAKGYTLMDKFGNPTPNSVVFQIDMYVKMFS